MGGGARAGGGRRPSSCPWTRRGRYSRLLLFVDARAVPGERKNQRQRKQDDHEANHQEVRPGDQDESPVQVSRRLVHGAHGSAPQQELQIIAPSATTKLTGTKCQ